MLPGSMDFGAVFSFFSFFIFASFINRVWKTHTQNKKKNDVKGNTTAKQNRKNVLKM